MTKLVSDYGWRVDLTDEQIAAGRAAASTGNRFKVWEALVAAGVPIRDATTGRTVASLAATVITDERLV